jgi:hypothetical protein
MTQLCLISTRESNILGLLITNQPEQVLLILGMKTDHIITDYITDSCRIIIEAKCITSITKTATMNTNTYFKM